MDALGKNRQLAVLLLRRTELVGRHLVVGALLVVAGGCLIGAFR